MSSFRKRKSAFEGKGIQYRLFIIELLVFGFPSLIILYIYYANDFSLKFSQVVMLPFTLLIILAGLLIMRKIFEIFSVVDTVLKRAGGVNKYFTNIKKDTSELHEVTDYFSNLIARMEDATSELKKRVFELFSIKELTEFACKTLDMNILLDVLLEKAMAVTEAQNGSVYIFEPEKRSFRVIAARGLDQEQEIGSNVNTNIGRELVHNILLEDRPVFVQDINRALIFGSSETQEKDISSFLCMLIYIRGNLLAILNLSQGETQKVFDSNDKQVLSVLISEIGFALENARLYKKIEEHLNDLKKQSLKLSLTNENLQKEILERKQIEENLEKINKFLKNILDSSLSISIISTDLDKNILFWNKGAEIMFGYKAEEVVGKQTIDILYPDEATKKQIDGIRSFILKKQQVVNQEINEITKDGKTLWVSMNLTPCLDERGEVIGVLGIGEDISRRKNLEQQLLQAQKMEAIGTLAGGIAHDFNNILTAILGYTDLAKFKVASGSQLEQYINQIQTACSRAGALVEQILSFSRQTKCEKRFINIQPVIREALKLLRASLPTTIEISQDIQTESGTIYADPVQIHQVLMNLCTNAKHAIGDNEGTLKIILAKVNLDGDSSLLTHDMNPGPYFKLSVTDTGHGMSPEVMRRIFEPYFTTKDSGVGTGLGLAVVHGIIKSHGGTIKVESEEGKGSTFNIYLPLIERPEEYLEEDVIEPLSLGNERILFVDDERTLTELGKDMLQYLGYEVVATTSSIEALELFHNQKDQLNLVITDMTMPNMTGDKLATEILKICPDIPIIICSGFSERMTDKKAKKIGISAFIMKPLVMRELSKTIRRILDKS